MEGESKDYVVNGNVYNIDNIWDYMEKDYWDEDDLKFDFWYRLYRHEQIFYKVMDLNGKIFNSSNEGIDQTKRLLEELKEKNKHYTVEMLWED